MLFLLLQVLGSAAFLGFRLSGSLYPFEAGTPESKPSMNGETVKAPRPWRGCLQEPVSCKVCGVSHCGEVLGVCHQLVPFSVSPPAPMRQGAPSLLNFSL